MKSLRKKELVKFSKKKYDGERQLCLLIKSMYPIRSASQNSIQNFEGEIIRGAEKNIEELVKTYFDKYPGFRTKVVIGDAAS